MKKMLMIVTSVIAISSYGDININWRASAGFLQSDATTPLFVAPGSGLSALVQLIWSTTDTRDAAGVGGAVSGDDVVLDTLTPQEGVSGVSEYGDYSNGSEVYAGSLGGAFIYLRIFQDAAPGVGDFYFDSPTLATVTWDGIASPQSMQHNTDLVNGNTLDQQISAVPEPSVLAFLGLGSVLMFVRRMRKA